MQSKKFTKRNEPFTCGQCGMEVPAGTHGVQRNHCPTCLYSQHVDVNPGDRQATCGGLMKPQHAFYKNDAITIVHACVHCGFERNNQAAQDPCEVPDDLDQLHAIMQQSVYNLIMRSVLVILGLCIALSVVTPTYAAEKIPPSQFLAQGEVETELSQQARKSVRQQMAEHGKILRSVVPTCSANEQKHIFIQPMHIQDSEKGIDTHFLFIAPKANHVFVINPLSPKVHLQAGTATPQKLACAALSADARLKHFAGCLVSNATVAETPANSMLKMTLSIQGAQCLYVAPVDVSQAKLVTSLSTEGSLCDHVTGFGKIFCMMGDAVLKAIAQIVSDLVQKLEGTMTDVVSTHGLPEGVSGAMIALDMELCKAAQLKTIELKPILYTNPATQINVYGLVTVGTAKHTYPLPKGAPTIKAKNMDTGTFESLSCQSSSTLDVNIAGDISVCILPTELMNSASPLEVAFDASVGCNTSCYYQQTVDFSKAVNVETNVSVADVCGEKSGFCAILVYPIIKAVSVIVGTLITSAL